MTAEKKGAGPILYIILVLILLLINGLLFYSTWKNKERSEELDKQRAEAQVEVERLDQEVNEYLLRLDTYKTDNEQLIGIRDSLKQVVLSKQKEIQKVLHDKNFTVKTLDQTKSLLASAQQQINELIEEKDSYIFQLDSTATALEVLRTEYENLSADYSRTTQTVNRISSEKAEVESLGSILRAENVAGFGVRMKKNGQEDDAPRAKRAEKLKICFDLLPTRIMKPGPKTLHLKIIGPGGTTIAMQSAGSGVFIDKENGEESMYTNKYTFELEDNSKERFCVYWAQDSFDPGIYEAELYQEGYQIGSAQFELK